MNPLRYVCTAECGCSAFFRLDAPKPPIERKFVPCRWPCACCQVPSNPWGRTGNRSEATRLDIIIVTDQPTLPAICTIYGFPVCTVHTRSQLWGSSGIWNCCIRNSFGILVSAFYSRFVVAVRMHASVSLPLLFGASGSKRHTLGTYVSGGPGTAVLCRLESTMGQNPRLSHQWPVGSTSLDDACAMTNRRSLGLKG